MSDQPTALNYLKWVNPLQGTASTPEFSQGNCLPLASRPFGMASFTPQSSEGRWIYQYGSRKLQGIRCTHQPSPWMADYGHFTVMAQTGVRSLRADARSSGYRDADLISKPHYFKAHLIRYDTDIELTPTERCAYFRFTFPQGTGRVMMQPFEGDSSVTIEPETGRITGYTRANSGGVPDDYALYFVAELGRPLTEYGLFSGGETWEGEANRTGERIGAYAEVEVGADRVVEMKVATSYICIEQAQRNLDGEIGHRSFEAVREEGEAVWNAQLGKARIEGATEEQLRTFYTCLYRALLFPHKWHEITEDGQTIHYSPYDGQLHPGVLYADNGFWDTHRTVYPLLSLLYPKEFLEIINGWVNATKEGGWCPRWPSPGYRSCMISTHLDAILADAYLKGFRDFDVEAAYAAMLKDAWEVGDEAENYGRKGIKEFGELGYVPADKYHHAVSCTLDYAYNDFCIALLAKALGRDDDYRKLRDRAFHYKNVYDPSVGFMRGKNTDGSWKEPFNEFTWGGPYVEGSAWQCSWAVPHDPAGLMDVMGGPEALERTLDRMMELPPHLDVGSYGFEIHEMTEMACAVPGFGQYAHSNQPVHHVLYYYACVGKPWKTQYWVRRVLDEMYGSGPDGLAGDEDNGEMASWYVLGTLGLFQICPGQPSYVLGSPLFEKVTLDLSEGKTLVIRGEGNSRENVYVQKTEWNGEAYGNAWIGYEQLAAGGELTFHMGSNPSAVIPTGDALPYSFSTAPEG